MLKKLGVIIGVNLVDLGNIGKGVGMGKPFLYIKTWEICSEKLNTYVVNGKADTTTLLEKL